MQRIVDGQFERFEVRAISGGHELRSRGLQVGGSWRVERRGDGAFIDTKATKEAIVALDVDSVTTAMLLAHTQKAGRFFVLRMHEGLESEVGRWDLALEEDGDHWLRTPSGLRAARFDASGALETEWVQLGSGNLVTQTKTKDQAQAGGLPLPPEKLALLTQAQSAAPAPQSSAPPPVPAPVPAPTDGSEPRER